jgi:hypothetical protein
MTIDITDPMRTAFLEAHESAVDDREGHFKEDRDIRLDAGLAAVLNLPETRAAVLAAAEREHAAMMANLPGWDAMSDLDKGAVLLHLHKRDSEGDDYAVENYPAKFLDDPRLTGLDREDACAHAARFEDIAEELDGDEYGRLYDLALDYERSNR